MIDELLRTLGAHGVRATPLRGRSASHRRLLLHRDEPAPDAERMVGGWPSEQRELALDWLRAQAPVRRWATLTRLAGNARMGRVFRLIEDLLAAGWAELEVRREPRRGWEPWELRWRDRQKLETLLGRPDPDVLQDRMTALRRWQFADPRLPALADSLADRPQQHALRRLELLHALDRWLREGRQGTRRQFAQFARGDTKAVGESEWQWLDETLGLSTLGIDAHTPGLWLRAPLRLHLPGGSIDLALLPDVVALTPATVAQVERIDASIGCWRVVENRTSFEQAARAHGARDGVLWLPGSAPAWWREAVATLLRHATAPLLVACDPDPAGVRIALAIASLWQSAGLPWEPWRMGPEDLRALPRHKPLGDYDRAELERLRGLALPSTLAALVDAMAEAGIKGEQEGLRFD